MASSPTCATHRPQEPSRISSPPSVHDPLTGLANRALLLDRSTSSRHGTPRPEAGNCTALLDLDDFKTGSTTRRPETGERPPPRDRSSSYGGACVPAIPACRLGGDEFAVLLEDLPSATSPYEIGARLLESLQDTVRRQQ